METIQILANVATIVGVPITIIGLLIAYYTLRAQIKQNTKKIDTSSEIMNIQNKYNSQGNQYYNCNINHTELSPDQIKQEYKDG